MPHETRSPAYGHYTELRKRGKKKSSELAGTPAEKPKTEEAPEKKGPPASTIQPVPDPKPDPAPQTPKIQVPTTPDTGKETPSLVRQRHTQEDPPAPVKQETLTVPFDEAQVQATWQALKEARQSQAMDTERLVYDRKLEKSGESNIRIYLESQLEISILEKFEAELIRFFRKSLKNDTIQLEKEVSEQESTKNLYTSKEKFDYMVKQNPNLQKLRERLGLDFEY